MVVLRGLYKQFVFNIDGLTANDNSLDNLALVAESKLEEDKIYQSDNARTRLMLHGSFVDNEINQIVYKDFGLTLDMSEGLSYDILDAPVYDAVFVIQKRDGNKVAALLMYFDVEIMFDSVSLVDVELQAN